MKPKIGLIFQNDKDIGMVQFAITGDVIDELVSTNEYDFVMFESGSDQSRFLSEKITESNQQLEIIPKRSEEMVNEEELQTFYDKSDILLFLAGKPELSTTLYGMMSINKKNNYDKQIIVHNEDRGYNVTMESMKKHMINGKIPMDASTNLTETSGMNTLTMELKKYRNRRREK